MSQSRFGGGADRRIRIFVGNSAQGARHGIRLVPGGVAVRLRKRSNGGSPHRSIGIFRREVNQIESEIRIMNSVDPDLFL